MSEWLHNTSLPAGVITTLIQINWATEDMVQYRITCFILSLIHQGRSSDYTLDMWKETLAS